MFILVFHVPRLLGSSRLRVKGRSFQRLTAVNSQIAIIQGLTPEDLNDKLARLNLLPLFAKPPTWTEGQS